MIAFLLCGGSFGFTLTLFVVGMMVLGLPIAIATGFVRALVSLIKELASVKRR